MSLTTDAAMSWQCPRNTKWREKSKDEEEIDPEQKARGDELERFWSEALELLKLDDPEQPKAKPIRGTNIRFFLPAPNSWISVYRVQSGNVGIALGATKNTPGSYARQAIIDDFDAIKDQIGGSVRLERGGSGRPYIVDSMHAGPMDQLEQRQRVFSWLAERVNTFVRVLRPRMRSAAADFQSKSE